jgi:hypothetical protein
MYIYAFIYLPAFTPFPMALNLVQIPLQTSQLRTRSCVDYLNHEFVSIITTFDKNLTNATPFLTISISRWNLGIPFSFKSNTKIPLQILKDYISKLSLRF